MSAIASPARPRDGSYRRMLWLAIGLCLLVRLGFLLLVRPWDPGVEARAILRDDALNYHRLAITLLDHRRFAESADGPAAAFRTPLYPVMIAGVYALAGPRPWMVLIVQSLLEAATVALLYMALARLFTPRAAAIAAILYALDPFLTLYTALPLTDVPFVFCLAAVLALLGPDLQDPGRRGAGWRVGFAGLCLGVATLVRQPSQYLPILIVPYWLWHFRARPARALRLSLLFVVAFGLVLAPWAIRNQRLFDRPFLSAAGSYQLLVLDAAPLYAAQRGISAEHATHLLIAEAESEMRSQGHEPDELLEIDRYGVYGRVARRHLVGDPGGFLRVYVRGQLAALFNLNTSGFGLLLDQPTERFDMIEYGNPIALLGAFFTRKDAFAVRLGLVLGPLLVLGYVATAIGIVVRLRERPRGPALLLLAIAVYFIAIGGASSGVRYRLPAEPFLLGFTATGVAFVWDHFRRRVDGRG